MKHIVKKLLPATLAWLVIATHGVASPREQCSGRFYPATAVRVAPYDVLTDIDLGFGTTQRRLLDLYGIVRPEQTDFTWWKFYQGALAYHIAGKQLTVCVYGSPEQDRYAAIFYADSENVNEWMIKKGYVKRLKIRRQPRSF